MTRADLLESILERLAGAGAAKALFSADETAAWPAGALETLVNASMLQQAQPASVVECTGCEENCLMPLHVFPAEGNRLARAFIACDKRDDVGRVSVDFCRLEQWQTTGKLIADVLAHLLGLSRSASHAADGKQWNIGVLKGKKHQSPVTLLAGDSLMLALAGHAVPLIEVLAIEENALTLDKDELIRRVDKPAGETGDPVARRIRIKARVHEEKVKGTKAFIQVVAKEEGISASRIKQLVSTKRVPVKVRIGLTTALKPPASKNPRSRY
ncbi:MAG: hypothetical protein ACYCZJ_10060 [Sulfuriferula sp.]